MWFWWISATINVLQGMIRINCGTIRLVGLLTVLGLPTSICKAGTRLPTSSSPGRHCRICQSITVSTYWTSTKIMGPAAAAHIKARCPQYPGSHIMRIVVSDEKVYWSQDWPEYSPVNYTAPSVADSPPWADLDIGTFSPRFNIMDGPVDRTSFEGDYSVVQGKPLNPCGRTGLAGRGLLGRWGPNHAADPIVTRWKVDGKGKKIFHPVSKLPILQFVSIKRKDCGEWAIPGGMVDPGELVSLTLQREFSEEALNSLKSSPADRARIYEHIAKLFNSSGFEVYKGYVDDPRNTDNAWMETVVVNFHDDTGSSVSELPLQAGDDAGQVHWSDVDSSFPLYASHSHFLEVVAKERNAHW